MPLFQRYLGIDYSGAKTADCGLPGLRVYDAAPGAVPMEVPPPPGRSRHWTRRGLAHWLVGELADGPPSLVGIDHAFSFPRRYFEVHGLAGRWPKFLEDFHRHWPTDEAGVTVDAVRRGVTGRGALRRGESRWRRPVDVLAGAKSPFHFGVPGSVASSTHAGLPWLLFLRKQLGRSIHFWPFDGWDPPPRRSAIAEVYPALWNKLWPQGERTGDQHDAYCAARWMAEADRIGLLPKVFTPAKGAAHLSARWEGWILGLCPSAGCS